MKKYAVFLLLLFAALAVARPVSAEPSPEKAGKAKPDLLPVLATPMTGFVTVKNVGTGPAAASTLLLKCRAMSGGSGSGNGCAESRETEALHDRALDGMVFPIPALAAGASHTVTLTFWSGLVWPKGTYQFTAVADARNVVDESNKTNNTATSTMTKE